MKPDNKRYPLPPDAERCTHVWNGWRCIHPVHGAELGHSFRTTWCRR